MEKVIEKERYLYMFREYTHNIPVIYSSLEGQYEGELYVDDLDEPGMAVLLTPFGYHFIAGNAACWSADQWVEAIFQEYFNRTGQKEAIVFSPNAEWEEVLNKVFEIHHGLKDFRKVFHLNKEAFNKVQADYKSLLNVENKVTYELDNGASKPYPVSRVYRDGKSVSFCSGFMLGSGYAEIDVATEEAYQGNGYAKMAAITLIGELLNKGIEPSWCTWPYRVASEKLALSLGFELTEEVLAHIWVEEVCGKWNA